MQSLHHNTEEGCLGVVQHSPAEQYRVFSDLADSFMKNFTTRRRLPKTYLNLYSIVQKPEETLRSYLDRFNTECTQIEELQSQAALMALVKGLREDTPFLKSLTKRPQKTMEEIQERSHDYLQQEEGQTVVKTDRSKKDNPRKEHFRDDRGRKEHRSNRSYYNPLTYPWPNS
ncbi:hypothetical protein PIB30_067490 [Stylosanthes scabra]|uniref:Retrotransposon gag domain-containing protein n=1 Tax=Stylosanthes scabra TaxID=79078 RepID=A0ABU6ZLB2_9FABA|nr:hypothetical protein [Stylosanthes scabra]